MPACRILPFLRASGLAAGLGLAAGAAQATPDLTIVAPTCVPGSAQTLQWELKLKAEGLVRAGRNPPLMYFCPVSGPDDFTTTPTWRLLKLQFRDANSSGNGHVVATLYRKSRTNGVAQVIGKVSSVPSPAVSVAQSALLEGLNFALYGYYVTLELSTPAPPVEAHAVMLTN